jgi:hypothetical protein
MGSAAPGWCRLKEAADEADDVDFAEDNECVELVGDVAALETECERLGSRRCRWLGFRRAFLADSRRWHSHTTCSAAWNMLAAWSKRLDVVRERSTVKVAC